MLALISQAFAPRRRPWMAGPRSLRIRPADGLGGDEFFMWGRTGSLCCSGTAVAAVDRRPASFVDWVPYLAPHVRAAKGPDRTLRTARVDLSACRIAISHGYSERSFGAALIFNSAGCRR